MDLQGCIQKSAVALVLMLGVACGSSHEESVTTNVVDNMPGKATLSLTDEQTRRLVGPAFPYDLVPVAQDIHLNMQSRRNHAWKVFESINREVNLAGSNATVPVWQTWYDQAEFSRIFTTLFRELPTSQQRARAPFSPDRVKSLLASWGNKERIVTFEPLRGADGFAEETFHGRGLSTGVQVSRTLFSPEYVEHFLLNYKRILDCTPEYIAKFPDSYTPPDPGNFSLCYAAEFPPAAVMIKAVFFENTDKMEVFDSSSRTMARAFKDDEWQAAKTIPVSSMNDQRMFSVHFSNNEIYRLAGMHVVTKEVREWVWATFWWSETPQVDFGADREGVVKTIDPAFRNYKMCTSTHFAEGDRRPGSHYTDGTLSSLGASLTTVAEELGPTTWCANPYLEGTFPKTNCIGCHQFSGTSSTFETRRQQVRNNFPTDFTFAFPRFRGSIETGVKSVVGDQD